jgi:hypothetical protein
MKAIKSIKAEIDKTIVFTLSKDGEPFSDPYYISEQTERFRDYVKNGIERMTVSELFSKREIRKVADFANKTIKQREKNAMELLLRIKRKNYKF